MIVGGIPMLFGGASAAGDPYFANVSLLMHMDGADNGTVFTDVTGKAVTIAGAPVTKTAIAKYGSASSYYNTIPDALILVDSADFSFGTGDFTIEAWVYPTSFSLSMHIFAHRNDTTSAGKFWMVRINATTGKVRMYAANTSLITDITSNSGLALNTWTHVACVRSASVCKIYLNGTNSDTVATDLTSAWPDPVSSLYIGAGDASLTDVFKGYIDEARITKGVARYTANFTPSTTPHPDF